MAPRWHHVAVVSGTHPNAVALTEARRTAYPHWAAGWDVEAADRFVVGYAQQMPVAGAAIRHDQDLVLRVSRLGATDSRTVPRWPSWSTCWRPWPSRPVRARFAWILGVPVDAQVPWQRSGYRTGPPYDGNADVDVWVERTLDRVW